MRQPLWYRLVCLGMLVATRSNAMSPSNIQAAVTGEPKKLATITEELEERAEEPTPTRHFPRALERLAPRMGLHQTLPTIPEQQELTEPSAGPSSPMAAGPSMTSSDRPPLYPHSRHRRTGGVDLGHPTMPRHVTPIREDRSPSLLISFTNTLPRIRIRRTYTSHERAEGLPPLPPVRKEQTILRGHARISVKQFITHGKRDFKQTLALTKIQFIDPQDHAVLKELDAEALAHPELLTNILITRDQPAIATSPGTPPSPESNLGSE